MIDLTDITLHNRDESIHNDLNNINKHNNTQIFRQDITHGIRPLEDNG